MDGCRADYAYDALGRLTRVTVGGGVGGNPCQQPQGVWTYVYDAVGNRCPVRTSDKLKRLSYRTVFHETPPSLLSN